MQLNRKQWNQGKLELNPFAMERRRAVHRMRLDAPADQLFQAACLTGQPGWLSAGSVRLTCSESGRDEPKAIWSESGTGEALFLQPGLRTIWTTTINDREGRRHQSVLLNPDLAAGTLDMVMEKEGGGTRVVFELTLTVLSQAGSLLFDSGLDDRMAKLLKGFGQTLAGAFSTGPASAVVLDSLRSRRRAVQIEQIIEGDLDDCFALACPVAELLWIDDWHFDLIYSESGKNETGCVFLEPGTGLSILCSPGANTYWYTTCHDTEAHRFKAVLLTGDLTLAHWDVRMTDRGGGRLRVEWNLAYCGLSPEGSRIIGERGLAGRMERALRFLSAALKQYMESSTLYRLSTGIKLKIAASLIGASLGRHFRRRGEGEKRDSNPAGQP